MIIIVTQSGNRISYSVDSCRTVVLYIPYHVPADFFSADFCCCCPCVRRLFFHQPIFLINHFFASSFFFLHADIFGRWSTSDAGCFSFPCVHPFFFTQRNRRYTTIWLIFFLDFLFSFQPQVPRDELLIS